jgi:hypothetical protein
MKVHGSMYQAGMHCSSTQIQKEGVGLDCFGLLGVTAMDLLATRYFSVLDIDVIQCGVGSNCHCGFALAS